MAVDLDRFSTADANASTLCALDDALESLTRIDPRRAQVMELRFFGGLSVEETAEVLHVSAQTVMRDWRLARAWLARSCGDLRRPRSGVPIEPPPFGNQVTIDRSDDAAIRPRP